MHRDRVLGVPADAVTMRGAVDLVDEAIQSGSQMAIFAMNPEKVIAAQRDQVLAATLASAELLIPDGIGVVMALRRQGLDVERVPGSELMPALCELAAMRRVSVYLLGARPEVNASAAAALRTSYPQLQIAGRHDGYFSEAQTQEVIADINASGAAIVFVALGSPRQERWIETHREQLQVAVLQGVGGTFDVLAGTVRRAPPLWLRLNLEWLYRLLSQPSRLLRQRALPLFAWQMLWQRRS